MVLVKVFSSVILVLGSTAIIKCPSPSLFFDTYNPVILIGLSLA